MAFLCIIHLVLCTWNKIKTCSFLFSVLLPPPCILHFLFSFNTLPLYLLLDNKGWMNQLVICHSLHKKGKKKKNLMVSNSFSYQTEDNFFFCTHGCYVARDVLLFSLSLFLSEYFKWQHDEEFSWQQEIWSEIERWLSIYYKI